MPEEPAFSPSPAPWLAGGLLLGAVIPFTLIVILPTNKRLLDPSLDKDSQLAEQLLQRWATLHAVRSALSLLVFLLDMIGISHG